MAERKYALDWGKITQNIITQETKSGSGETDGRFFVVKRGDDGNGQYKFRFVPPKDIRDIGVPYAKWFHHDVNLNGKKLFTMCPKTLGKDKECPICTEYLENWKSDKEYSKKFKRKNNIVSNIIVLSDPLVPANNGKLFLYKFGVQVLEKILLALDPPKMSVDPPIQVFDYYEGATFKLMIKTKEVNDQNGDGKNSMPNYEDSYFEGKSELDEKLIDFAHENAFPLGDFIKREKFDIEEEVKQKFDVFMSKANGKKSTISTFVSESVKENVSNDESNSEKINNSENTRKTETIKEEVKTEPDLNLEDDDDAFWAKVKNKK